MHIVELEAHIKHLCARHDIICTYIKRGDAWAAREFEEIGIYPIRSRITYMVALHEIGHVVGRFQDSADGLVRERWAWRWARTNALIWTPAMQRRADSYYAEAMRRST